MHEGCSGNFASGKHIVNKIRMMGFNKNLLAAPFKLDCLNCDTIFQMKTMESLCPSCNMVYGVTPCHSHSVQYVKAAGVNY